MAAEDHHIDSPRDVTLEHKISDSYREDLSQVVSEEEALARARRAPEEALPLCIVFGPGDPDNPRCWARWRKWYITCVVSMLNVVTYVELLRCLHSLGC